MSKIKRQLSTIWK